jgi:3-oxoacid CoA-transferase subunit B
MSWSKEEICEITALLELKEGYYINLGIGMPTEIANFIPNGLNIMLQSENGVLGIGPYPTRAQVDPDLINAGKETITDIDASSYFDSATSFSMIRGGHINLAILGALQVSQEGDLANWCVPGKMIKGMGGAMDLVSGVQRIVVIMDHNAKDGSAKLVKKCNLPLTGAKCVERIITNLGIFDVVQQQLILRYIAPNVTADEIKAKTDAEFTVQLMDIDLQVKKVHRVANQ